MRTPSGATASNGIPRTAVPNRRGWPRYRTDPGREQTVGNDYSSHTSDVLFRTSASATASARSCRRCPQGA